MRHAALLLALGGLSACLSVPHELAPECSVTADCDQANGEICDDGTCWGNPPTGVFAAVLSPPSERKNLATRELPELMIHPDGWIDEIRLDKPLLYSAQLVCEAPLVCDDSALGATITVTRPSTFPGGPGFKAVVTTDGADPFQLAVPSTPGEYTITVMPSGRDEPGGETTPAQLMPPLRTTLAISSNQSNQRLVVGRVGLPTVTGTITNDEGDPQSNYRVVALGRWDATSAPIEVSTVDYTGTDGQFSIQLSANLVGNVELVARPTVTMVRPTLYAGGISGATGTTAIPLVWPAEAGGGTTIEFDVKGVDGSGETIAVAGARVVVSAKIVTTPLGLAASSLAASYSAEATTGEDGRVSLPVLDGAAFAASYRVSIVPPASSTMGALYDQPLSIVQPILAKRLPTRLALRGVVQDVEGKPLGDVSVTARPSLRFVWSLDPDSQAFLTTIPPPTTTTPNTGEFLLWVDPNLADTWATTTSCSSRRRRAVLRRGPGPRSRSPGRRARRPSRCRRSTCQTPRSCAPWSSTTRASSSRAPSSRSIAPTASRPRCAETSRTHRRAARCPPSSPAAGPPTATAKSGSPCPGPDRSADDRRVGDPESTLTALGGATKVRAS